MYSTTENLVKRLPDVFKKESDSNIYKLLRVLGEESDEIKKVYDDIKLIRDINQAEGTNLDNIGKNLNVKRDGASDEVYRLLLKLKVAAKKGATFNVLIEIISAAANIEPNLVYLVREKEFDSTGEPASLLLSLPTEVLNNLNLDYYTFLNLIQDAVAGGVIVKLLKKNDSEIGISPVNRFKVLQKMPYVNQIKAGQWPGGLI